MRQFLYKALITLQIMAMVALPSFSVEAKLAHSIDETFTEQALKRFVYLKNKEKFSLKKSVKWLKENYKTREDHAYINKHVTLMKKVRIKPVFFYYDDHIEIRSYGRSYGKITDIDFLYNGIKLNNQDIFFREGYSVANIHQQIMSAIEIKTSWLEKLLIPRAEALGNIAIMMSLFVTMQAMQQAQAASAENETLRCTNPGSNSPRPNISREYRQALDRVFNRESTCAREFREHMDYIEYVSGQPATPGQRTRARDLCNRAMIQRRNCDRQNGGQRQQNTREEQRDRTRSTM
ncbi:MAG: hypothetical protein MJK18_09880 [Bdellovibrionales bacterium]|nr:hypothetical protein [Bdellovibrionales bacterium]